MTFLDFTGKKIMIVGAASGIGRQTTIMLDQLGATVVLIDRDSERLQSVKDELSRSGEHITIIHDVLNVGSCKDLFDQAMQDGQKLDGLVYTAGIAKPVPLRVMTISDYNKIFGTNFFGFINFVSLYIKKKYNNGGSIVGISAANAHIPQKCMSLYAASKAAIEAAVKTMSIELSDQDIRINAVIPGAVSTPMSDMVKKEMLDAITSKQLLGIQTPEQIASVIVFLLSERASAVTGRSFFADGGMLGQ